jgi:hypothetical protein
LGRVRKEKKKKKEKRRHFSNFFFHSYGQSDLDLPMGARFKTFISVLLEMCPKGQVLLYRDAKYVEQIVRLARDSTRRTQLPALMRVRKLRCLDR